MLIDTLTAKLVADTGQFESGMARARGSVQQFDLRTTGADRGLTMLRRGFESLAVQATGVAGPLGRVAAGLLQIGGGELGLIAAVGAIGAIAGAYRVASHDAVELTKSNQSLRDSYLQLAAGGNKVVTIGLEIAKTQLQVAAANERVLTVSAKLGLAQGLMNVPVLGAVAKMFVGQEGQALDQAGIQVNLLTEMLKLLGIAQREAAAEAALHATQLENERRGVAEVVTNIKGAQEAMFDFARGTAAAIRQVDKMNEELALLKTRFAEARGTNAKEVKELGLTKTPLQEGITENVKGVLEENVIDPANEMLRAGAFSAGQAFVNGLMEGMFSLKDLLKTFLAAFLEVGVLKVVKTILKVGSPSQVGIDIGRNFSLGLAMGIAGGGPGISAASAGVAGRMSGSASLSLNVSGMPRAGNPLAAARDGDWQRFLRESNLVARGDGFRFA